MSELETLKQQVSAVNRCTDSLESAKEARKYLDGRKLFFATCRGYDDAVKLADENVITAQETLDSQIRINAYANGFTKEMEAY